MGERRGSVYTSCKCVSHAEAQYVHQFERMRSGRSSSRGVKWQPVLESDQGSWYWTIQEGRRISHCAGLSSNTFIQSKPHLRAISNMRLQIKKPVKPSKRQPISKRTILRSQTMQQTPSQKPSRYTESPTH